jgi:quercetin dioxygenase-like cupin family protein
MLTTLPFGIARAQTDDSRVTLLSRHEVFDAFARGRPLIEVGDYKIHASRRDSAGVAEIHTRDTDIVYVLKGSATLVTGGTPVSIKSRGSEELRGSSIDGGDISRLTAGDVVVIPNGVPHWFSEVKGPFLYYVVKVRQAARPMAIGAAR